MILVEMQNPTFVAYCCYAISLAIIASNIWRRKRARSVALQEGCGLAPEIPSRWPLRVDVFWSLKRAAAKQALMPLLKAWHDEFGSTLRSSIFGDTTILTCSRQNIRALLSSHFEDFELGPRNDIVRPLIGNSIFAQDGIDWKQSRAFMRPHFVNLPLPSTDSLRRRVTKMLKQLPENTVVDLQPLLTELVGDMQHELICGAEPTQESCRFFEAFTEVQTILSHSPIMSQLWARIPFSSTRRLLSLCRDHLEGVANRALARQRAISADEDKEASEATTRTSFADAFAVHCKNPVYIRDQLHSLLFAGRDTMTQLLSWTLWSLARHPDEFRKLKLAISRSFVDGLDSSKSCEHLDRVMKEVLRLYPPISINVRYAVKDTLLPVGGGPDGRSKVLVPKGGAVNFSIWTLQRRRDIFGADADEFRPDRWLDPKLGHDFSYIPFSTGPRTCLGQKYAMKQCADILVLMLLEIQDLEFEGDPFAEVMYEQGFSLGIGGGCLVKIRLCRPRD